MLEEHLHWAEKDHVPSMLFVGTCYLNGEGVEQNVALAIHWFDKAATLGSEHAHILLGQIYELGYGVPPDCDKAIEFYTLAELAGSFKGSFLLGLLYDSGSCAQKDALEALKHYRLAAKRGHLISSMRASKIMRSGCLGARTTVLGWACGPIALIRTLFFIVTNKDGDRIWGGGKLIRDTPLIEKLKKGTRFDSSGFIH